MKLEYGLKRRICILTLYLIQGLIRKTDTAIREQYKSSVILSGLADRQIINLTLWAPKCSVIVNSTKYEIISPWNWHSKFQILYPSVVLIIIDYIRNISDRTSPVKFRRYANPVYYIFYLFHHLHGITFNNYYNIPSIIFHSFK